MKNLDPVYHMARSVFKDWPLSNVLALARDKTWGAEVTQILMLLLARDKTSGVEVTQILMLATSRVSQISSPLQFGRLCEYTAKKRGVS